MRFLDFSAPWCGQCKVQASKLKTTPIENVKVEEINCEEQEDLASKYGVRNLPTMILVDDEGNEIKKWVGITPPQKINEFIKSL